MDIKDKVDSIVEETYDRVLSGPIALSETVITTDSEGFLKTPGPKFTDHAKTIITGPSNILEHIIARPVTEDVGMTKDAALEIFKDKNKVFEYELEVLTISLVTGEITPKQYEEAVFKEVLTKLVRNIIIKELEE